MFIKAEPVLSGGRGQDEGQEAIRTRIPRHMESPSLTFIVSDLR